VWQLRRTDPHRRRAFRVPAVGLVATLTIIGCLFLFFNLPQDAMMVLPVWTAIGLVFYALYGYRKSHLGRGIVEVPEADPDAPMPVGIRPPDGSYDN